MTIATAPPQTPVDLRECYTEIGLTLPGGLPIDVWGDLRLPIEIQQDSSLWALGDWYLYGEGEYDDRASQYFPDEEYSDSQQKSARWLASVFAPERRRSRIATRTNTFGGITWTHHRIVGGMTDIEDQEAWLNIAQSEELNTRQLQERIDESLGKVSRTADKAAALSLSASAIGREWLEADHSQLAAYLGKDV